MLTFVNIESSLTIVNETTIFIKTVVFGKTIVFFKIHATLLNVVLHEVQQLWLGHPYVNVYTRAKTYLEHMSMYTLRL